jgi:NADPH:quinone reductase
MRAIWLKEFGAPDVLIVGDAPDPVAGAGQAVIAVEAASITFVDTLLRAGRPPRPEMSPELPVVLGNGVGGIVTSVGPTVDASWIGRRVVSTTGGANGYAEQAAVAVDWMIPVPHPLSTVDATALLADGRTAVGLARLARIERADWVLVEAAGGGVGSLLLQLATTAGGRVIGAASSVAKRASATDLGATATVDYTQPGWTEQVRDLTGGAGADVIFDGVGGAIGRAALDVAADGGRFVVHGAASGSFTSTDAVTRTGRDIRVLGLWDVGSLGLTTAELSRTALAEAAAGRLRPVIGQTFPLDQVAAAHAAIEARNTIGKTLLTQAARRRR